MPFERLLQELARAHVLVSASRIESFGMAIAEARACGCVVLARKGGHVESQLDDPVANSDAELADQLLELARDSSLLHARLARVKPPPARSWSDVAREFMRV
jgi:glycosyltransferase involved in cell wall biosynthesis